MQNDRYDAHDGAAAGGGDNGQGSTRGDAGEQTNTHQLETHRRIAAAREWNARLSAFAGRRHYEPFALDARGRVALDIHEVEALAALDPRISNAVIVHAAHPFGACEWTAEAAFMLAIASAPVRVSRTPDGRHSLAGLVLAGDAIDLEAGTLDGTGDVFMARVLNLWCALSSLPSGAPLTMRATIGRIVADQARARVDLEAGAAA